MYIKSKTRTKYKNISGENLSEIRIKSTKDYNDKLKILKASKITPYGLKSPEFNYIRETYGNPLENNHDFRVLYLDIETAVLDKEMPRKITRNDWKPEGERAAMAVIISIQLYDTKNKEFYILGLKKEYKNLSDYKGKKGFSSEHGEIRYIKCQDEEFLLKTYLKILSKINPTVIVGWNSEGYDYPYITMRIIRVLDKNNDLFYYEEESKLWKFNTSLLKGGYVKQLSPIGAITYRPLESNYGITHTFQWLGYILEDYLLLFKKYTYTTLVSNSLSSVAQHELGDDKINHDEFTDFAAFYEGDYTKYDYNPNKKDKNRLDEIYIELTTKTLQDLGELQRGILKEEFRDLAFEQFINYGIQDIILLIDINNKLKLIDTAKKIAYTCGVTMDSIRGTIRQWNSFMFNNHYLNKQILPLESSYEPNDRVIMEHALQMKDLDIDKKNTFGRLIQNPETQGQNFVGGMTRGTGKFWREVFSLDFGSLYPSIIQWANIGIETLIEPKDLPKELLDLRAKYAIFYPKDVEAKDIIQFDIAFVNDIINNKEISSEIERTLKKYNVSMTPNGMFFDLTKRSVLSQTMEDIIKGRKIDQNLMFEQIDLMKTFFDSMDGLDKNSIEYKEFLEKYNKAKSLSEMYDVFQMAAKILV